MQVTELDEQSIRDIGHAFGYYDYGTEKGMNSFFRSRDAVAEYICGYVRCVLAGGFVHTTSARGEAYIAYKLPGQKVGFRPAMLLLQGMLRSLSLKELFRFAKVLSAGGPSLEDRLKKEHKPCVFVGMVCVREAYQGQGYMRKVLELAFAEGGPAWCAGGAGYRCHVQVRKVPAPGHGAGKHSRFGRVRQDV